jgi:hypothetical protein
LVRVAKDTAVTEAIANIIDEAVELKMAITEEQVLYNSFWVGYGEPFVEESIHVMDEEPAGCVLLCLFPGLGRTIKIDEKISEEVVVKARAMLEDESFT